MDERENEHTENNEVVKQGGGGRRGEVNKQCLMVLDIFLEHWWHKEQHLPHTATWFYLTNSHTAISYSPVFHLDQNAFLILFYIIPLTLLL